MSPTPSQQWTRRMRYSDQHLRVSDAERNEVAERLATHYSDGRLDQAEFDDRVGRAMAAKTRGDLDGLFDDLPDPGPTGASGKAAAHDPAVPYRSRRRRTGFGRTVLLVVLIIAAVSLVSHALTSIFFWGPPWLLIFAIAAVILLAGKSTRRRHDR